MPDRQWPMMNSGGSVAGGFASCRRKRAAVSGSAKELKAAAAVIVPTSPQREGDARPPCSPMRSSHTPSGIPCQNRGLHHGYAWNVSFAGFAAAGEAEVMAVPRV